MLTIDTVTIFRNGLNFAKCTVCMPFSLVYKPLVLVMWSDTTCYVFRDFSFACADIKLDQRCAHNPQRFVCIVQDNMV